MPTLHTVSRSPARNDALGACLATLADGAGVLLLEDAVYAAVEGCDAARTLADVMPAHAVHVLEADWLARGLGDRALVAGAALVDDGGFVDLCCEYDRVQAWF